MNILRTILTVIFVISAFAIVVIVLMQEGKSAGLGAMGGAANGNSYWERNRKHSLEGRFEQWTKITAIVFILSAFLIMLIPNPMSVPIYPDLMDEMLPDPVDGGNEEVDALGQPREDGTTDDTTTNNGSDNTIITPVAPADTDGTSDISIVGPDMVTPKTDDASLDATTDNLPVNDATPEANDTTTNATDTAGTTPEGTTADTTDTTPEGTTADTTDTTPEGTTADTADTTPEEVPEA